MKLNNDSIVSNIGGFETNIKLGFLIDIFKKLYEIDYADEIIEEINADNESFIEDMFVVISRENNILICTPCNNEGNEGFTKVLEKVFEEEFYYMRSDRFYWDIEEKSIEDADIKTFMKKMFVDNSIESNGESVFHIITKDHDYDEVREIDESNFLSNEEKIMIDRLEKDEVEKYLDAKYQFYYIRKKDFNKDKWWLGWTCEHD